MQRRYCIFARPLSLHWPIVLSAAMIFFAAVGCQRSQRPDLGAVSGTVTLDGAPLPDALVEFHPSFGRPSFGATDARGYYSLVYIRNARGAKIGDHKVSISSGRPEKTVSPDGKILPASPELVPKKYNEATTLTAEVKPGGNTINFDLSSR